MDKARSKGIIIPEDEKIVGGAYLEKGFQSGQVFYNKYTVNLAGIENTFYTKSILNFPN